MMNVEEWHPVLRLVNFFSPVTRQWPRRRLVDIEMILAIEGRFELELHDDGDRLITQLPREVIFIYPGEEHSYRAFPAAGREPFFSCVHFQLPPETAVAALLPRRIRLGNRFGRFVTGFRSLQDEYSGGGRFRNQIADCMLREILLRLAEIAAEPEPAGESFLADAMIRYLDEHLEKHPGRAALAMEFHISQSHVNRLFRRRTGCTPTSWLHRRLAERGYALMLYDNLSVKETAERLGFATPFHFSRVFKRVFGFSPSAVRTR